MKDRVLAEAAQGAIVRSELIPGQVWQHTKTVSLYEIVCLSVDEERLVPLVTYRSMEYGYVWTRELAVFLGLNEDGKRRFVRADDPSVYYDGPRCKLCGSSDLQLHGIGNETFRSSCRWCGGDPV